MAPVKIKPGTESSQSPEKQAGFAKGEMERVELEGRQKFFTLRTTWSGWIIAWITGLILFNAILTILVGAGQLNFEKYKWFVTSITVETFLQIFGMGYVAVHFLFSDKR